MTAASLRLTVPICLLAAAPAWAGLPASADLRIASGGDDVEQGALGAVIVNSSDLELVHDGVAQTVGLRFGPVPVAPGSRVTAAWVQFTVDEATSTATQLAIRGEAADHAAPFTTVAESVGARARTQSSAPWAPPAWTVIGEAGAGQRTPDLSAVVQEIVDRPGWLQGAFMVLIIEGSGRRVAESFEGSPSAAPLLHLEFEAPVADQVRWTITGPDSVTVGWRGPVSSSLVEYGPAGGPFTGAAAGLPAFPSPSSSSGPFWEARLADLDADTLYRYRLGGGIEGTFRTPPPRGSSGFWLAAQAEIGSPSSEPMAPASQEMVAADHAGLPGDDRPRFVLVAGGLALAPASDLSRIDDHFEVVSPWALGAAYMPAWGEGEVPREDYEGRFDFPHPQQTPEELSSGSPGEEWMWFDYGNVRFISYPEPHPGAWDDWAAQAESIMAQAQRDASLSFIVTWGHRPAWSSGELDAPGDLELRNILASLRVQFPKYVLNLSGRSRHYERSDPQATAGLTHVVTGGGGAGPGPLAEPAPAWSAFRMSRLHHVRIQALADRIEGHVVCGPSSAAGAMPSDPCPQGAIAEWWVIPLSATVAANKAPQGFILSPAGPVTIAPGQSVNFQAAAVDPDADLPISFQWDFGGGAPERTSEDPGQVTFSEPGIYTVRLRITDAGGSVDPTPDKRVVTVAPAPGSRVHHAAPWGSDAAEGSYEAPFRTIAHALSRLVPGDRLLLRGGTYRERPLVSVSGTQAAPIVIQSYPGERAVIDSALAEFRTPGNADWELVDEALGEYRSVKAFPAGGSLLGFMLPSTPYENGRAALVTYVSAEAFRSPGEEHVDALTPFYAGPGLYRETDGRIHVRLAKTAEMRRVEDRYGEVLSGEKADPRGVPLLISTAPSTVVIRGSHLVLKDLTFQAGTRTIQLGEGARNVTLDGIVAWGASNVVAVTGPGVSSVSLLNSRIYGDVPRWVAWSDAKTPPAPAERTRGTAIDLAQGARGIRIAYSHVRGGHDGIGVNDQETDITIEHNRIENFADDCLELEGLVSVGRIAVFENYIANCLVAIAPGQGTASFEGPLLVYRNVVALLRNPFINRKEGLNNWNGGGRYGHEYMFKHGTGPDDDTRNAHYYHNTLVMLGSAGKGMNLIPKNPEDSRIANNLLIMINGTVNGSHRTGAGQVLDGNLYWKMNSVDRAPLLNGKSTVGEFAAGTGLELRGLGDVPLRGTDPMLPRFAPEVIDRTAEVWELAPGSERHDPSRFTLGAESPAAGSGIVIPAHPVLGPLPDTRASRDIGALPLGVRPWELDVFPYVPELPALGGPEGRRLPRTHPPGEDLFSRL
ncbi:MAG TPA: PKD domain-containing protein [Candidatus Polarisedimenticolia bacterium]|nr:PKD domain-containing protein [Candidatus Polarisedimenticolia bacterium]